MAPKPNPPGQEPFLSSTPSVPSTATPDQALTRKFSLWSMSAFAFCVLGTWAALSSTLSTGLSSGGPATIVWGLVLVAACNLCVAASLGELCSAMPTALGQAYYIHRLCNHHGNNDDDEEGGRTMQGGLGRFLSYLCAWVNTFGWLAVSASLVAFNTNFIIGLKLLAHPDWRGADEPWVSFLIYVGLTLLVTVVNVVGCRRDWVLPWWNNVMGALFAGLFVTMSLAMIISVATRHGLSFQKPSFVFASWLNTTTWSDGVVWFLGLLQSAYGLTAFDSVIHMVEELPDPRRNAPKAIYLAILSGTVTGLLFMVVCLFCVQDITEILQSTSSTNLPFIGLVEQTVGKTGSIVLISLFTFNTIGQNVSCATTASRLTWGFAREGGFPGSAYLSKIDPYWKAPVRAVWAQGVITGLIGVLYLFSTTVLTAIVSASTVTLMISYGLPIGVLLVQGRDKLPPGGTFRLGRRWGYAINVVSMVTAVVTTVFFFFPGEKHPIGDSMNYAVAVFGVMLVMSLVFWVVQGRRTYLRGEGSGIDVILGQPGGTDVEILAGEGPEKV